MYSILLSLVAASGLIFLVHADEPTDLQLASRVKVSILSDGIVAGVGTTAEWGFSALVEVSDKGATKKILFDTGGSSTLVMNNAKKLGIDLCGVEEVILSHHHPDHTGGFLELRQSCMKINPKALSVAYVGGEEFFWPRMRVNDKTGANSNNMTDTKEKYEELGGRFVITENTTRLAGVHGVFLTGKIPREIDGTVPSKYFFILPPGKEKSVKPDAIPEDMALAVNTPQGLVVLTGCGHAGIINIVSASEKAAGTKKLLAIIGGLHLHEAPVGDLTKSGTLAFEAAHLQKFNAKYLLGCHCTGLEQLKYLRTAMKANPRMFLAGSVGTLFDSDTGIIPFHPNINGPLKD